MGISKGSKKRKIKYAPDKDGLANHIRSLQPFTEDVLTGILLPIRLSFEALKTGQGTDRDFSDICAVINVVIVKSLDINDECLQAAKLAEAALLKAIGHHSLHGTWELDNDDLLHIDSVLDLHEQICRLSTPLQMLNTMKKINALQSKSNIKQLEK